MKKLKSNTLLRFMPGVVECRICGFMYMPGLEEDRKSHQEEHRRVLRGGVPYRVRELMKQSGWEWAQEGGHGGGFTGGDSETGKRAVVFAWWMRAVANGVPKKDFEDYMAAHFAVVDASVSGDEKAMEAADRAVRKWNKYPLRRPVRSRAKQGTLENN